MQQLTPRAAALARWLQPAIDLVREEQDIHAAMRQYEATADDYDEHELHDLICTDEERLAFCRSRLSWYRARILRMITDADWTACKRSATAARDLAVNRYYRGLPLSSKQSAMNCATIAGVSARRVMQLNVAALNCMAEVWREEDEKNA